MSVLAFALAFAPTAAKADGTVQIGNLYTGSLKFSLHCLGDNDWHEFSLNSLQFNSYSSANWNGNCGGSDYELRIGTNMSDGTVSESVVRLSPGQNYVLAKPGDTNKYTAYDARTMIVLINQSTRTLSLSYACSGDSSTNLSVSAQNYSWIHLGSTCKLPLTASIETLANDGSKTILSRPLAPENTYTLSWNDTRQAWDIEAAKQGGGAAVNDGN
jgi:hypothetical protein